MCDCFHLAFPNWHAASSGTAGRRLRAPEPGTEDDSVCDEASQFTEGERPRPQGSSPVEEFPEKYTNGDKECEAEHDPRHKSGGGKKSKKSGIGSMFEKRSTPKMSKLKEAHSPESEVIVKTATDGSAEGLVYRGGGKEGIFIKGMVPESPASKSLKLKEGDQILSATVYFDDVPYEDAVQILEHAQAYRVELCLKRKPDITETEAAMESDVIPEEELGAPEMREQGKTKRRGDARISWPKFPSFGKGRKTRFTRSHSSSEADEQRKLELSPTTSDTESPIKTQDTLKGKKRHKMKLSLLTKRSRISSSEDTDAPTNGQTSSDVYQTASEMLEPECLDSLSGDTPQVYVTEELRLDQKDLTEPKTAQHKVDLICIDSTLKTADLTVALADQGSSSGIKSPTEKKKKKEKSELKVKILGKDKSHKKDGKAKASPKRLKTLGASIEIADQSVKEKSDSHTDLQRDQPSLDANSQMISSEASRAKLEMSVPKVELDISDVTFFGKSHQKGEEQAKKDKEAKQKKETKTCPSFKLPKIGLGDITTEETIQTTSVNAECPTKVEKHIVEGPALKDDPYDRLSKSSHSRTQLPKREDIEIPGMEDMSLRTKAKGIKEPKVISTGRYEDIQTEDVQMSIDVDSVKEAVSKLPGFKLPQVDTFGMPIPEEITVIDANAQRISVKTPTKVADTRSKHEAHLIKFDLAAADLTSEELLIQTKVDYKKTEKVFNITTKQSEIHQREEIVIPGKESVRKEFGFKLPKQIISGQEGGGILGERTILLQEVTTSQTETRKDKGQMGGVISDGKEPELDSIDYIDSVGGSPAERGGGISLRGFGVHLDATRPRADISSADVRGEDKEVGAETMDKNISIDGAEIKVLQRRDEIKYKLPNVSVSLRSVDAAIQEQKVEVGKPEVEIKPLQTEVEFDGQGSKFKMPKFGIKLPQIKGPEFDLSSSKKDIEVKLPEAKAGVKLPEAPEVNLTLRSVDVSIPEQMLEIGKPELEIKPLQTEVDLEGQGSKFKMSKFGIKLPQIKGPEFDLSSSKKDIEVKLPEARAAVKLPEAPEVNLTLGRVDVAIPEQKVQVGKPESEIKPLQTEVELDGQGSKFKIPKFGIKMPQIKGPEFDLSLSKKDGDVQLPKAKAGVKLPEAPGVDFTLGTVDVSIPEQKVEINKLEVEIKPLKTEVDLDGQGSKLKMPTLGIKMPKIKGPEFDLSLSKKDADVILPVFKADGKLPDVPEIDASLGNVDVSVSAQKMEIPNPELQVKPLKIDGQPDGQGSKFKMPELGITMPQVKGPEIHFGLSKKDDDVTLPEAKAEVKVPEVKAKTAEIKVTPKRTEGSALKFKMPSFNLPKFGIGAPNISVEAHDIDKDVKLGRADLKIPEEESAISISAPSIDIEGLSIDLKTTGADQAGQGSKLKMPHLPKVKGPEFDLSFSKKDAHKADVTLGSVDVSVPEQKMEVGEPELEIKALQTEVELDGHGSKFKMPKFGISMPKVKGPDIDLSFSKKDVKSPEATAEFKLPVAPEIDFRLGKAEVSIPDVKMEVEKPELEMKSLDTEVELDGHGSRFKMPKFGITMPKVKGPELDFSLSRKDVDVRLPEAKAEVSLPDVEVKEPSAKVEVKSPEINVATKDTSGSPSRFKMPTFSFSKPKVKVPDIDLNVSKKDADITSTVKLPEAPKVDVSLGKAEVLIPEVKVEVKKPEVQIKPLQADVEYEGQGGKFKMPKFGISLPKVKGPDVDLSFSKKDVKSPEATAEFKLPEAPEIDAKLGKAEVSIPDVKMEVEKPELEMKSLDTEVELDGHGSRFKMPKFGITMPKVKGPELDFSLSKKDVDVRLPEAKAEVSLPDVEVKEPSTKVEVKAPEINVAAKDTSGSPSRFKMPTFSFSKPKVKVPDIDLNVSKKDTDITSTVKLPEAPKVDVSLGKAEVLIPEAKVEVKKPEVQIKPLQADVEYEGQGGKFKMPKFGISLPKVKGPDVDLSFSKKDVDVKSPEATAEFKLPEAPEIDVKLGKAEVSIPDVKMDVEKPELEMKSLDTQVELDGHGSRFKMPKFGITMPKVKGPELDFSLSKKDVDIRLPEAKAEVSLPDVELKEPSTKVDIKAPEIKVAAKDTSGSPSRFKMPTFSFSKPKVKVPDIDLNVSKQDTDITSTVKLPEAPKVDVSLGKAEVLIPEVKVEVKKPEVQIKPLQADVEYEGQGGKFKMPKFGISMPKVKGPDIDLSFSKKDVKSPEATAEFKLPEAPEIDVKLGKAEVSIPDVKMDVEKPELEMKSLDTEVELDGHGSRLKMPKFGITMPKVKGPELDFSLSRKDVDVRLPEAKAEVSLPDVEVKEPSAKVEVKVPEIKVAAKDTSGSPSRFKMPTFSFSKPKVKVPDIDLNVSKKDTDITSTVNLPEAPKVDVSLGKAEVLIPEVKVEVKKPEVQIKPMQADVEYEGQGGKFKMPKFGISMPKVKGPDVDLSFSKKDVNVTLPEAKAEVSLPDVELKDPSAKVEIKTSETEGHVDGSPSKFKMPTFKFPKFGIGTPTVTAEVPDMDKDKATVDIAAQKVDIEGPSLDVKMTATEGEGKESKFKMPSFGISMPKVQGPKIDLSLSKDVDVKSPEATAELKLPEAPEIDVKLGKAEVSIPDVKMEVEKPELEMKSLDTQVELDGHGSKFKMPKFGITMPKVKGPEIDFSLSKKDVDVRLPEAKAEVSLPDVELKEPSAKVEVKVPEIKVAAKDTSGSPSRFKMPTFSFSKPKVKVPDIDLNVSKKDTDITSTVKLPEAPKVDVSLGKAEVLIPEVKVEVKKPEVQIKPVQADVEYEGQGGKFKMPKFGISLPKVKGPDVDLSFSKKDVNSPEATAEFKLPEAPEIDVKFGKAEVSIPDVKMEVEKPELEMKSLDTQVELEGHGSKLKMPKFGITMPKVKGPELDFSLSKKDVDVRLPEAKAEVSLPDVELKEPSAKVEVKAPEIEVQVGSMKGSPSKFKLPTFKFPKFGVTTPNVSAEVPDIEHEIKIDGAGISVPDTEVEVKGGEVDIKAPEVEAEIDRQGSKFKMPKFGISMPKVTGPEMDLSSSNKDVDVKIPEAKAEVKLPDIDLKQPSAEVQIKPPEIKVVTKDTDGSPSKFKMPTFKLPKFGIGAPSSSMEVPDMDKDVKISGGDIETPKEVVAFDIAAPSIDTEGPSIDLKTTAPEREGKGSKFKLPSLSFSVPQVKSPDMDLSLSKTGVDVTLPEAKADVQLPDAEVKEPSAKIEIKAPGIEVHGSNVEESPSKFKMPTFKLPKFGASTTPVGVEVPDVDIKVDGEDLKLPEVKAEVKLPDVEIKEPVQGSISIDMAEGDAKVKKTSWTLPTFSFSKSNIKSPEAEVNLVTPKVDVSLPEVKAEVHLPHVDKESSISVEGAELDAKLKKPKFSMPKFSFSKQSSKDHEVDVSLPEADVSHLEGNVEVTTSDVDLKPSEGDVKLDGQESKFKMPKFGISMPKVKGPDIDLSFSKKDVDVTQPKAEVGIPEAEVKLPGVEVKESSANVETESGGSPSKFKMPTVKMPKFGGASYEVTVEAPDADKAEIDGAKLEEDVRVEIKAPGVEIKTDSETPKTETDSAGHGSPSRFKLPSFKMPKLSFSKPKPEEEHGDHDGQEVQPETAEQTKSPNLTLTAIGEIFKNIDVEFDVSPADKVEDNLEASKESHETSKPSGKQLDAKEKETNVKEDTPKSPERTGWFKFPKFGLSSPSESAKTPEKDEHKNGTTPETGDEEVSPTCSVQSSDAFADISSTMTSELVGPSISSPTKVTVKYSDPSAALSLEEIHGNVITSTTRTQVISLEPHLPEKITILSSEVSSSSEDTFRPAPGLLDAITAKLGRRAQLRSPVQSQGEGAASWAVEDSLEKWSLFGDDFVRETSSERSESKETIVITKQITRVFESSEETSSDAATSIQRLRDSVHSDKMRFFDGAEK
ncbi:neuroblast differentiation-associated protein AHNAK-like [Platichthys flesus]|uniref:neuroblast differentiation-associated protein AHNAK-like n=1 Tax=Platichthys flesus TaxID=8260 RepID=UPI002DB810C6|nr:neuroblast differentiation-associated protein AHNAK-like [Platichthys flesus]